MKGLYFTIYEPTLSMIQDEKKQDATLQFLSNTYFKDGSVTIKKWTQLSAGIGPCEKISTLRIAV